MKAIALTLILTAAIAHAAPEIGKPAPAFTAKDSSGAEVSLSDFKGKTVVLEWMNEGCPFVQKHYNSGNMQKLQKAAVADDVVWLTIVSSAPGKQGHLDAEKAAAKKGEIGSTALLIDEDGTVGKAYDAKVTPEMFVIDGEGTLVYMGAIDDKPNPDPSTIDTATNYVTAAIESVRAGTPVETTQTKPYGCGVKY
jgi:peroxiredoxin